MGGGKITSETKQQHQKDKATETKRQHQKDKTTRNSNRNRKDIIYMTERQEKKYRMTFLATWIVVWILFIIVFYATDSDFTRLRQVQTNQAKTITELQNKFNQTQTQTTPNNFMMWKLEFEKRLQHSLLDWKIHQNKSQEAIDILSQILAAT